MNYTRNALSVGAVFQSNQNTKRGRRETVTPASIIRRREIEPLLFKAAGVLKSYEKATFIPAAVLDETGRRVIGRMPGHGAGQDSLHDTGEALSEAVQFCVLCRARFEDKVRTGEENDCPCTRMLETAIDEARRSEGIAVFVCRLGLTFWVSPLFSNGRLAGACVAGGIPGIDRKRCAENINVMTGGAISKEAAELMLEHIPEKSPEEIQSLARLLRVCAEQVSTPASGCKPAAKKRPESHAPAAAAVKPELERALLAALRRGDSDTVRKILGILLESLKYSNKGDFHFFQQRAMELVILLSREAARPPEETVDDGCRYLDRIQNTRNAEELSDVLHHTMERMAGQLFSFQGIRHSSALRKAERFIWENYTRKISLKEIASASGLSAPYFSSIFKQEMGENLSGYLNRLRVERAAAMLTGSDLSLHEIARTCGFEDQSWFSKIFKGLIGVSPGKYRERGSMEGTVKEAPHE